LARIILGFVGKFHTRYTRGPVLVVTWVVVWVIAWKIFITPRIVGSSKELLERPRNYWNADGFQSCGWPPDTSKEMTMRATILMGAAAILIMAGCSKSNNDAAYDTAAPPADQPMQTTPAPAPDSGMLPPEQAEPGQSPDAQPPDTQQDMMPPPEDDVTPQSDTTPPPQ